MRCQRAERGKKWERMFQNPEMKRVPWEDASETKQRTVFIGFRQRADGFPQAGRKALGSGREGRRRKGFKMSNGE